MRLLAETIDMSQWILFGVLILIIIISPIFMRMRNKKEMEKAQQVMDSLKKGDKVLTSAGVIGKIVGIDEKDGYKTVTIETGNEKHKGYLTVDIAAIYMNLSAPIDPQPVQTPTVQEKATEPVVEEKTEPVVEETEEVKDQEEKTQEVEEQPKTKKSTKKSK